MEKCYEALIIALHFHSIISMHLDLGLETFTLRIEYLNEIYRKVMR